MDIHLDTSLQVYVNTVHFREDGDKCRWDNVCTVNTFRIYFYLNTCPLESVMWTWCSDMMLLHVCISGSVHTCIHWKLTSWVYLDWTAWTNFSKLMVSKFQTKLHQIGYCLWWLENGRKKKLQVPLFHKLPVHMRTKQNLSVLPNQSVLLHQQVNYQLHFYANCIHLVNDTFLKILYAYHKINLTKSRFLKYCQQVIESRV